MGDTIKCMCGITAWECHNVTSTLRSIHTELKRCRVLAVGDPKKIKIDGGRIRKKFSLSFSVN